MLNSVPAVIQSLMQGYLSTGVKGKCEVWLKPGTALVLPSLIQSGNRHEIVWR